MNVVLATASKPIFGGFPNPCNDQAVDVIRIQAMLYGARNAIAVRWPNTSMDQAADQEMEL